MIVGSRNAAVASAASAASAAAMLGPSACSTARLDGLGARQAQHAEQAGRRQHSQQPIAQPLRFARVGQPARVRRGAERRADEIHRQQHREGVDGVLGHLAEHADDQHFIADSEQAGGSEQQQNATRIRLRRRWRVMRGSAANSFSATAAHRRLSAAQTAAVRARPNSGTSKNAAASTPRTAPKVLPAYSAAIDAPCRRICARTRSIAGSVAPIAAVAGSSKTKVPQNATDQCHAAKAARRSDRAANPSRAPSGTASARLHTPIAASHAAYQRAGFGLRSMRGPSSSAPTASPPKNAATTASTAADSWPSHSALCCVQTIW